MPANALCDHEFRVAWGAERRDSTENPASAISGRERRTQKPRTAAARHRKARLGAILLPTEAKKTKRLPAHNTADEIPIVSKLSLIAAFITERVRYNIAARPSASPRPRPSVAASIVGANAIKAAAKISPPPTARLASASRLVRPSIIRMAVPGSLLAIRKKAAKANRTTIHCEAVKWRPKTSGTTISNMARMPAPSVAAPSGMVRAASLRRA